MAKELPYFKFEPSEWLEGQIQICSDAAIVCFTNMMSGYWSKLGCISYAFALHKYCRRDASIIQELIDNEIIQINDDEISIDFLDEQLNERTDVSEKRRKAAQKRWSNASALQVDSKSNAIRKEEKRKEEKRKEDITLDLYPSFEDFWNEYDKKTDDKGAVKKKWDKLPHSVKVEIMNYIPNYKLSQPTKKYRKNPSTFLNQKGWEHELIFDDKTNKNGQQKQIASSIQEEIKRRGL